MPVPSQNSGLTIIPFTDLGPSGDTKKLYPSLKKMRRKGEETC